MQKKPRTTCKLSIQYFIIYKKSREKTKIKMLICCWCCWFKCNIIIIIIDQQNEQLPLLIFIIILIIYIKVCFSLYYSLFLLFNISEIFFSKSTRIQQYKKIFHKQLLLLGEIFFKKKIVLLNEFLFHFDGDFFYENGNNWTSFRLISQLKVFSLLVAGALG